MYLRTTKRKRRDGSAVAYYQLAHNVWDPDKKRATAKIIHSFGRADDLDRDALVRLTRSIARVCGLTVVDPAADDDVRSGVGGDVLVGEVAQKETRRLGAVLAIEALWERLGIGPTLRQICREESRVVPYERALLAMTANRLCEPSSKLGVWDRWLEEVYLPGCDDLKLDHMYEAMDVLHRHADEVEEKVFFQTADLLNLAVDLVFYDTTTASFAVDYVDEDDDDGPGLRQLGYSKEGTWSAQVVVALAVTRDGIPVRSWVLPGNTSDVTTVERVRADLRGWKLGRTLFVADSGMNSAANRQELAKACGRYVLASRVNSVAEVRDEVLSRPGRYKEISDDLRVKEVVVGEGAKRRRYIVCFNPRQAKRQKLHREQVVAELEEELARHPNKDADAKWAARLRASGRYGRYVTIGRGDKLRIDRAAVKAAARSDGKWVLITNDDTLSVEDAAQAYKGLLVIERCFRTLKTTQIQMRPMFHWVRRRIEAHVKLCILALLIERVAVRACGESWARLRRTLDRLQVTEFETPTHRFFRRNDVPNAARRVLKKLEVSVPKTVVAVESEAASA